jgi:GDP-4-dehydro-6-deoxy-D-mannose reductase
MRVLITGITGFVGSHLAELALERGAAVFGSARWRSNTENVDHLRDRITLVPADLRDPSSVQSLIAASEPDYLFHLAAQSFVSASWEAPAETLSTNTLCQVNLLESLRVSRRDTRVLAVGSSEEYGLVYPDELPIRETNPLRPLSPYAVSKVTQDLMAYQYFKSYGLHVVRSRAFNHTGPRRGEVFAESNFARQVAEIEAGLHEPVVYVGDLTPTRDFSDVRDIVRGYWDLLDRGTPGEVYNLCSGTDWSIGHILDLLIQGSSAPGVDIRQDPARLRPSDLPTLRGSRERIERALGWRPEIPLERTLTDLLEYWRHRVKSRLR